MKNSLRFFKVLFFLILSLLCFSCKKWSVAPAFESSDPLANYPGVQWAVVSVPYAACRESPDYSAPTKSQFREGQILMVTGEQTVQIDRDTKELWYAFDDGWIPSSLLKVCRNKFQAEEVVKNLRAKKGK